MSRIKHLPKKIPPREIPFEFKCEGDVTQESYDDSFEVLVPNVRMMGQIGVEFARLNAGIAPYQLDVSTRTLHNSVAWLMVCLINPPEWLIETGFGLDTLDTNLALELFTMGNTKVREWKENLRGSPKDVESTNGTVPGASQKTSSAQEPAG